MNSFYPERVRLRQERNKPYPGKKKAVGINLSPQVVDYFKGLADPFTLSPPKGLPYQKWIDLMLKNLKRSPLRPAHFCAIPRLRKTKSLDPVLRPQFSVSSGGSFTGFECWLRRRRWVSRVSRLWSRLPGFSRSRYVDRYHQA